MDNVCVFICCHQNRIRSFRVPKSIYQTGVNTSYYLRMNFTLHGRGGLVNGNPKVVCSQSRCSDTKISTKLLFFWRPSKQRSLSFFSGNEIYIPERVDTSHHLWMNFTLSWWGGSLINVSLRVYFDVFGQSSRFNFTHQNRVRSMFLEFL